MKRSVSLMAAGLLAASVVLAADVDGKKVYDAKCALCHGADGKGKAAMAKMKKVELSALDLTKASTAKKPVADLSKDVTKGVGKMSPVKVTPAEADAVAKYVASLGGAKK